MLCWCNKAIESVTLLLGKPGIHDKPVKNESQQMLFYGHIGASKLEGLSVHFFYQIGNCECP